MLSLVVLAAAALAFPTKSFKQGLPLGAVMPAHVSQTSLGHVAFAKIVNESLFLSTFDGNPFGGRDALFYVPQASQVLKTDKVVPQEVPGQITWPNSVTKAPKEVFGQEGVIIAGGFLVPGKSNGGIWFTSSFGNDMQELVQLFAAKGFFYHQAEFYDVDGDGTLDILTCRASKGFLGAGKGDLTWLSPVDKSNPLGEWQEFVLGKGCDTYFILDDINGDGVVDILAAEFWGKQLSMIEAPNGIFSDPSKFTYTVLDKTIGAAFDLQFIDINGDGRKDVLATNHLGNGKGAVYAYEIPSKKSGSWSKHMISQKYPIVKKSFGAAAPGQAQAFFPDLKVATKSSKPHVVVAGDASASAFLLVPNSLDHNNWEYTTVVLHQCGCTVGGIAVGDVNNDGKTDIFIPCYESGQLATYSY